MHIKNYTVGFYANTNNFTTKIYRLKQVKIIFCLKFFNLGWFSIFPLFPSPDYSRIRVNTAKNNGFPFLDILRYLKNTHKNPKFGRVRLGWEFPGWELSHFAKFGIFMGIL